MISRTMLLGCALLGTTGYLMANHWDDICGALGIEDPVGLRAVQIAKSAFSLAVHSPNHKFIQDHMDSIDGVVVVGWQTQQRNESLYLVKFVYEVDGERNGYYFEVNVGSTMVSNIEAESELAKRYGIQPRATPLPR